MTDIKTMQIKTHDNGWSIITSGSERVIEYDDTLEDFDKNHSDAIKNLLYDIMEGLNLYNSKHNKYRVNIEVKKQ